MHLKQDYCYNLCSVEPKLLFLSPLTSRKILGLSTFFYCFHQISMAKEIQYFDKNNVLETSQRDYY